jgi:hypothetical protein
MKHGMQKIGNIWDPVMASFLTWYEAGMRFGLLPADMNCYNNLLDRIAQQWHDLLTDPQHPSTHNKYLGLFDSADAEFPGLVFLTYREYKPSLDPGERRFTIPTATKQFFLGSVSMIHLPNQI